MRLSSRRFIAAVATALTIFAASATCDAAVRATPPPPGSVVECNSVYKQTQILWNSFEAANSSGTPSSYRSVDSQIWQLAQFLAMPLCMETDRTHDGATMDARRLLIGMAFNIAGAFTEANLKKYHNARAFANSFESGVVDATTNPTEQTAAALDSARKQWPGFDQFLAHWKSEVKKLQRQLDALKVPKETRLNPDERPGH